MLHQRIVATEHTSNINVHHLCVGFDCGRPVVGSDEGNSTTFDTETSNAHASLIVPGVVKLWWANLHAYLGSSVADLPAMLLTRQNY